MRVRSTGLSPKLRAALARFPVATLYEAAGRSGAMSAAIKPIAAGVRLVGTALTVQATPTDNLAVHVALGEVGEGEVIVVACGIGDYAAIWGEIMTAAATFRGAAGLVTDGAVRDKAQIIAAGFPAFASAITVNAASKEYAGLVNSPIACGGIPVLPGDIVVGDDDGVVVLPKARLRHILDQALVRQRREEELLQQIRAGKTTLEAFKFKSS